MAIIDFSSHAIATKVARSFELQRHAEELQAEARHIYALDLQRAKRLLSQAETMGLEAQRLADEVYEHQARDIQEEE